jgi:hypothetical protein
MTALSLPSALMLGATALLVACAPRTTILTATGAFKDREVSDFTVRTAGNDTRQLKIVLSGAEEATLRLTLQPADRSCWLSDGVQHACTQRAPVGSILEARFEIAATKCEVTGWLEELDEVWQLDLSIEPSESCDEGRLAASIEP